MSPAKSKFDKPIYVICSKDNYLANEQAGKMIEDILTPDQRDMNLLISDGDKIDAADVFDELRTLSFSGGKRVVFLKDADKFVTDNRPLLERYFDQPSTSGVLILHVNTWRKTTNLAKKLSADQHIEISELKGKKVVDFVVQYAKNQHGKSMTADTAYMLVEMVGNEPGRLTSEIDKFAVYDVDKKVIDQEDVSTMAAGGRIFDAFNIIDSMGSGDVNSSISKLRKMFASDKSTEYSIVGAFAYHFRQMLNAKSMMEKGVSPQQAAKNCGVWYNRDQFMRKIRNLSLDRIAWMVTELGKIDYQVKTGASSVSLAMEQLIIKCCIINKKAVRR